MVAPDLGGLDPSHPGITTPARRSPPPELGRAGKASSIEDRTHITTTVPLDASEMETVAACIEAQEYEEAAATFNAALIDAWMGGTSPVNMKILHWTPVEPE